MACLLIISESRRKVGVPQGSVLWPLLFFNYLIPLRDILNEIDVDYRIYADDSTLYFTTDNVEAGTMKAQQVVYRMKAQQVVYRVEE